MFLELFLDVHTVLALIGQFEWRWEPYYPFPYWRVRATSGLYAVGPRGGFPTQTPGL